MFYLLLVSWSRSDPALRCTFCCRSLGLEVVRQHADVRYVAGVLVCCRCLSLVVPQHLDVRFIAGVLVSERRPSIKMYFLIWVSLSRSGTPAFRYTIYCRYLGSGAPALRCTVCCRYVGQLYDLLPVSCSQSGSPARRWTICCRCLLLEVVPQH